MAEHDGRATEHEERVHAAIQKGDARAGDVEIVGWGPRVARDRRHSAHRPDALVAERVDRVAHSELELLHVAKHGLEGSACVEAKVFVERWVPAVDETQGRGEIRSV